MRYKSLRKRLPNFLRYVNKVYRFSRVIQFYEMAPMSLRANLGLAANLRRAAAMLVSPAQRIKLITVLRNAAITGGIQS